MIVRIITALLLIPLVLAAIFYAPAWLFLGVISLFVGASTWELLNLLTAYGLPAFRMLYVLTLALPPVWFYLPPARLPFLVAGWLVIAVWTVARVRNLERGFLAAGAHLGAFWAIGVPFALAGDFHAEAAGADPSRPFQLLLILITVWACDSGAFFVGRAVGSRKITPRLSPGKTLEGFTAGLAGAVLAVVLLSFLWFPEWSRQRQVTVGLVLGAAAMIGDLFESLIKRGVGIKDTSRLIPGHGGVLDRVDSLLFAFPAYYVTSALL